MPDTILNIFKYINSFNPHNTPVSIIIIPILQMKKLRCRYVHLPKGTLLTNEDWSSNSCTQAGTHNTTLPLKTIYLFS